MCIYQIVRRRLRFSRDNFLPNLKNFHRCCLFHCIIHQTYLLCFSYIQTNLLLAKCSYGFILLYLMTMLPIPGRIKMLCGSFVSEFANSCTKSGCDIDLIIPLLGGGAEFTCSASLKTPSSLPLLFSIVPPYKTSESLLMPFKDRTERLPSSISLIWFQIV